MKYRLIYLLCFIPLFIVSCQKKEDVVVETKQADTTQQISQGDNLGSSSIDVGIINNENQNEDKSENANNNIAEIDIPQPQKINISYKLEKIHTQKIDLNRDDKSDFLVFYRAVKNMDTNYFLSMYLNINDKLVDIYYYELPLNLIKIEDAEYTLDNILKVRYILTGNNKIEEQKFHYMNNKIDKIEQ